MKNKLIFVANARIPTEKAHGIQIMKMCEAFTDNGFKVELIVPKRIQVNTHLKNTDPFEYYDVKNNFHIKYIPCIDLLFIPALGEKLNIFFYYLQNFSFSSFAFVKTCKSRSLIYTRSKFFSFLRSIFKKNVVFEAHDSSKGNLFNKVIAKKSNNIVVITKSIENSWKKLGADTIYAPDGVGPEFFQSISKKEARKILNLNQKQKIILYTGSFYEWKGTDVIIKAGINLKRYDFYLIGGSEFEQSTKKIKNIAKQHHNIHYINQQPYNQVPLWLRAADILLLTGSIAFKKSREDTSPLKLFEYMASGTPILAINIPSIREILNEQLAVFYSSSQKSNIIKKLEWMLNNQDKIELMPMKAKREARQYLWEKRAAKIINAINHK